VNLLQCRHSKVRLCRLRTLTDQKFDRGGQPLNLELMLAGMSDRLIRKDSNPFAAPLDLVVKSVLLEANGLPILATTGTTKYQTI
jgi:hypothetical protein